MPAGSKAAVHPPPWHRLNRSCIHAASHTADPTFICDSVNALEKPTTLSASLLTQRPKLVRSEDVFLAGGKYS